MKKIVSLFIFLLLLVGCSLSNSPTSKVEELLNKYQTLDSDIKSGIDDVLKEENLNTSQKERYRKVIEKQYRNLAYEVKDERIDGDTATITVEIEVIDYKKVVNEVNNKNYIKRFFFSFSSLIKVFIAVSTAVVSPKKANVVICCGQLPLISTGYTLLVLNARSA